MPGDGPELQPAVAWAGCFYFADEATGTVHVVRRRPAAEQKSIPFDRPGGPLELEVRENYLFINAPGSSTARVVDDKHHVRRSTSTPTTCSAATRRRCRTSRRRRRSRRSRRSDKPSAPRNVSAAAGNAQARVTWQSAAPNGAAITRYVVEGAGQTFQVGANQRSVDVTGLTNGETYRFAVHAVNKKGDGPARTSNPVRPDRRGARPADRRHGAGQAGRHGRW